MMRGTTHREALRHSQTRSALPSLHQPTHISHQRPASQSTPSYRRSLTYPSNKLLVPPQHRRPIATQAANELSQFAIPAGLALVAVLGGGVFFVTQGGRASPVSPLQALKILTEDPEAILVDIRSQQGRAAGGSPDLRQCQGKSVQIPFLKVVKDDVVVISDWDDRLATSRSITEDSTIVLLDSFGKDSPLAAKEAVGLVSKIVWVSGGAEGNKGWKTSGLPWREPSAFKLPSLASLGFLNPDGKVNVTPIAIATATGAAAYVALVTGVEQALEILGAVGLAQFGISRLLFAENRRKTVSYFSNLWDSTIGDLSGDLQKLSSKLLDVEGGTTTKVKGGDVVRDALEAAQSASPLPSSNGRLQTTSSEAAKPK